MSKQQEILKLYNQQLEDLNATEQEAKKYLLSIAKNNNIKVFINDLFDSKDNVVNFNEQVETLLKSNLINIKVGDKLNQNILTLNDKDTWWSNNYKNSYIIFNSKQVYDYDTLENLIEIKVNDEFIVQKIIFDTNEYFYKYL